MKTEITRERVKEMLDVTGLSPKQFSRVIQTCYRSVYAWLNKEHNKISPIAQRKIRIVEKRLIKMGKLSNGKRHKEDK